MATLKLRLPRWFGDKEFTCNARDACSIPGSEDALEEGILSNILAWAIPWTDSLVTVHGVAKNQT